MIVIPRAAARERSRLILAQVALLVFLAAAAPAGIIAARHLLGTSDRGGDGRDRDDIVMRHGPEGQGLGTRTNKRRRFGGLPATSFAFLVLLILLPIFLEKSRSGGRLPVASTGEFFELLLLAEEPCF